ncbi:hypothetical protein BpHYR1_030861 [Brachionus plicatilis]|uniref:Secreted protein n=1 Tax=Brachionus plicatilis TaxID=10195 RepID=A0A3M7Q290_BRAPC|nr:hypothetical protein BpHYR1_030861 [Brachionus plicatilis]
MICVLNLVIMNSVNCYSWFVICNAHFIKTFERHVSGSLFKYFWRSYEMNVPVDGKQLCHHGHNFVRKTGRVL